MIRDFSNSHAVTLNLFQGLSTRSSSKHAERWMLKQVQHDDFVLEAAE
jgi:hypothetical protein